MNSDKSKVIFISCGQCGEAEIQLGKEIAKTVRSLGFQAFFAEEVQDLDGLDTSILRALHDCAAFITVLHPRGKIRTPDGRTITRASVWIEQEIAIAAYIQHIEKRKLPVIAFRHADVSLEGIRQLLHLNPIRFATEADVIAKLRDQLESLGDLRGRSANIELRMRSDGPRIQDGHHIQTLTLTLINETSERIPTYNGQLLVPRTLLNHFNAVYAGEQPTAANDNRRCFAFSENGRGALNPHSSVVAFSIEYCPKCAFDANGGISARIADAEFEAKAWLAGREVAITRTVKQLGMEKQDSALDSPR